MKKFTRSLFVLLFSICTLNSGAQMVYIPDSAFRAKLSNVGYASCIFGDSIDSSCPMVMGAVYLDVTGGSITSLEGLEAFPSLGYLICQGNQLTVLPTLPNSLVELFCAANQLTFLPTLPGSLRWLDCSINSITSLPALPDSLDWLHCNYNQLTTLPSLPDSLSELLCYENSITSLPALPDSLTRLVCSSNQLSSLPALPNTLTYFQCSGNVITSLPALPDSLITLYCDHNQLTSLPVLPGTLINLACGYNQLTSLPPLPGSLYFLSTGVNQLTTLPTLPDSLRNLYCDWNDLTALPALPDSLEQLTCGVNQITSLPVLPNTLEYLNCGLNQLTSLPSLPDSLTRLYCHQNQITSLPELPDSMYIFYCYSNPIQCLPRLKRIVNLDFHFTPVSCLPDYGTVTNSNPLLSSLPLCDLFNPNSCQAFWNISGKSYFDENNNCDDDSLDVRQKNMKIDLYRNSNLVQAAFTGSQGYYSFDADTMGIYEIRLDTSNIPFDVLCPVSNLFTDTVSVSDSLKYERNFALKCKAGFDVGVWSITSGLVFRPARNTFVHIGAGDVANFYGTHCANGVSGTVTVTISGAVNYYSPAPGAIVPTSVIGNTITWSITDFGAINLFTDFNFIVQTDTTAPLGSQVCFAVSAIAGSPGDYYPANDTLTHCFTITGSFDPNEKEVYPAGDMDVNGSRWLTYTIRFQNTGTAAAEHVYIADTLDANLDISTFQLLAYSHQPYVQVLDGGVMHFNFPNINLPDSNSNEPESHGFVQYKIRLKDNLLVGTQIQNKAYIFFDFNPPVITNTTINTLLSVVTEVNSAGDEFQVHIYPNPGDHFFTLSATSPAHKVFSLVVTDLAGREIERQDYLNMNQVLEFGHELRPGFYFVITSNGDKKKITPIIKK